MIDSPELGYTPSNFNKVFKTTHLTAVAFQNAFGVPRATFHKWMNGQATPSYKRWCRLLEAVQEYNNK